MLPTGPERIPRATAGPSGPDGALESAEYGPWNPGISSQLPAALLPLATIFRPEHVFTSLEAARERIATIHQPI